MAHEFHLPDVGEGIATAEIVEWHVAVGDDVREDQPLVDVQTDKATVVLPCPVDGTVLRLGAEPGDTLAVHAVLAVFGTREELEGSNGSPAASGGASEGLATSPDLTAAAGAVGNGAPTPGGGTAAPIASPAGDGRTEARATVPGDPLAAARRPLASPAVRKLALDRGIDLRTVAGSGPGGRILREDLDAAAEAAAAPEAPASAAPDRAAARLPAGAEREPQVVPLRGTRRVIARNMTRSWQSVPHIIDYRDVDATRLMETRRTLRARAERAGDAELAKVLTLVPLVAKIAATVVGRHPRINASVDMEREEITLHSAVHLSIAIAAADGLTTPVVRDADRKSVAEIGREVAALAAAAREKRLTIEQLTGGTLTVNNFGSLGSVMSTPIIAPGQAVNLGMGAIRERPLVRDGTVVAAPVLTLSCSGDHRILDGAELAAFVTDVAAALADPIVLLADLT